MNSSFSPELWGEMNARGAAPNSGGMLGGPMGGAGGFTQAPPSFAPQAFTMPPMPPPRPQGAALASLLGNGQAGGLGNAPMPPPRPAQSALDAPGDPMQLASAEGGPRPLTITPERQVGIGSWLPERLGNMIDPNSLVGKLMALRNPSPAPGATPSAAQVANQPNMGLLPQLYRGLFG